MRLATILPGVVATSLSVMPSAAWSAPPVAGTLPDSHITVPLADLDLDTAAGMRMLERRLAMAARRACTVVSDTHVVDFHEALADCYHESLARAREQIHAARLAARLAMRSKANER